MSACGICTSDSLDEIEEVGKLCLAGSLSWSKGAERAGLKYYQSFKNHMEKHFVSAAAAQAAAAEDEVLLELQRQIDETSRDLLRSMAGAPAELRPLYATAIRNLREVMETKPSQQHLIAALKTIHEITGMRIEQQMMLQFAQHAFQPSEKREAVESTHDPIPVLEAVNEVMEVEEVGA